MGCAVGDYDNDGWADLYVSAVLGPGKLFHNRQGRFQEVTARAGLHGGARWGTGCAWLDYDRDGLLDLYVAGYVRYRSLKDDLPCYVRKERRSYCVPSAYEGTSGVLYRNVDGARFEEATSAAGLQDAGQKALGVVTAELNDDGWTDLLVANDTVPNRLFVNRRGHFEEAATGAGLAFGPSGKARAGMGIDVADWRNDGRQTVALTHFARESIGCFVQSTPGEISFTDEADVAGVAGPSAPYLGFGLRFLDVDNDGYQDLCAVNGHIRDDIEELEPDQRFAQPALLFMNQGGRRFTEVGLTSGPPFTVAAVRRALASGDLDRDGRLDLVVTRNGGKAEIWRNETPDPGHWLSLRLIGKDGNRDAIGARVVLQAGPVRQTQWVRSGGSYLAESDRRLHFGLGSATQVNELTVRWPSGASQSYPVGAIDRELSVHEEAR
jgi:hypothetical protein